MRIVAFGDSTTAPRGDLRIYADILRDELPARGMPAEVFNAGVGGNSTGDGAARFQRDVLDRRPDVVILLFGINDAAADVWKGVTTPRVPVSAYRDNLAAFARALTARGARVILATPNPLAWTDKLRELYGKPPYRPDDPDGFNVLLRDYAAAARALAGDQRLALIDLFRDFEEAAREAGRSVGDLLLDGMHPNDAGHRLMADRFLSAITPPA